MFYLQDQSRNDSKWKQVDRQLKQVSFTLSLKIFCCEVVLTVLGHETYTHQDISE